MDQPTDRQTTKLLELLGAANNYNPIPLQLIQDGQSAKTVKFPGQLDGLRMFQVNTRSITLMFSIPTLQALLLWLLLLPAALVSASR